MKMSLRIASLLVIIGIFGFSSVVMAQQDKKYNLVKVKTAKVSAQAFAAINNSVKMKSVLRAKKNNNTITAMKNYSIYKVEGLNSAYIIIESKVPKITNFDAYSVYTVRLGNDMVINIICQCSGKNDDCEFFQSQNGDYTCNTLGGECGSCAMTVETLFAPFK